MLQSNLQAHRKPMTNVATFNTITHISLHYIRLCNITLNLLEKLIDLHMHAKNNVNLQLQHKSSCPATFQIQKCCTTMTTKWIIMTPKRIANVHKTKKCSNDGMPSQITHYGEMDKWTSVPAHISQIHCKEHTVFQMQKWCCGFKPLQLLLCCGNCLAHVLTNWDSTVFITVGEGLAPPQLKHDN